MAGGAPSLQSNAIAAAAAAAHAPTFDQSQIPPLVIEQFVTGTIKTVQVDEQRDDADKVAQAALVELRMAEPPMLAQLGDTIVARGGTERFTKLTPDLAIALGESLIEDGEAAKATMKEQPLKPVGLELATPADAAAVAAAADAAKEITRPV